MKRIGYTVTATALALLTFGARTAAAQENILYSFGGVGSDPSRPAAGLVADDTGNLYGTSQYGGAHGSGAVFELSPASGGGWSETVLWNFCSNTNCSDGFGPLGSLVPDKEGNLYGTTSNGGINNGTGTVFELSPGADGVWTEKTLFTFAQYGTTGAFPQSNLIFDSEGNLYGTTASTAANAGNGVVFELTPSSGAQWTEKILWTFGQGPNGNDDGCTPTGGLIFDAKDNLYGTAAGCGVNGEGGGIVFELSPTTSGTWTETVLHGFPAAANDGTHPQGTLTFDGEGNLYGTTRQGGSGPNAGTVFELSPQSNGAWAEKVLWNFEGQPTDGSYEIGNLIVDAQGNLYGISSQGGAYASGYNGCSIGCGTIFELSPATGGGWAEKTLYDFGADATDGHGLNGGLIADAKGNLYGTTTYGGAYDGSRYTDWGTVWELAAAGLPTFSPAAGTYYATKSVAITSSTAGATIYYTVDGTTPTTASTKYTGPIAVTASETIKAFSEAVGYPNSAVVSADYVILAIPPVVLTPSASSITTVQGLSVGVVVQSVGGRGTPTGSVTLSSGSYSSAGTKLSSGSAAFAIPAGSLAVGSDTVTVTYTPDQASSLSYAAAKATATVTVEKLTPTITWPTPTAVAYGTALSAEQLDATASVAGTFAYSPAAGRVLGAGIQTLSVTFTPGDASVYNTATSKVTLTVNKGSLTVTAGKATKVYGAALPALTYTITGFVIGETQSSATSGAPSLATTATAKSSVASYPITVSVGTLKAANYLIGLANGSLSVTPAALTAAPINVAVGYDVAIPKLTYAVTGFVNGDTSSILTGTPEETTTAVKGSKPGTYPITLAKGTLKATANYALGFKNGTLLIEAPAATPVLTTAGSYAPGESVTITDTTRGAVIYYTLNGTTPSTGSAKYTAPIKVWATETIKAIAVATGYGPSAVASATYTIEARAAEPVFKPAAGTYSAAQSVSLTDTTTGAIIYYTVNGATPTTASTKYSGPIAVTATETVKAIAVAPGYTSSGVASATYTIK